MDYNLIKMMTSGIKYVNLNPREVSVSFKKTSRNNKKECYNNSFMNMGSGKYVLGYYFMHGTIPIEHAWIKEQSEYFDVTIEKTYKDDKYISLLELSHAEVYEYVKKYQSAPGLFDYNRFMATKDKNV